MDCFLDQAMYAPGASVGVRLTGVPPEASFLRAALLHLEETVLTLEAAAGSESISFLLPQRDFTGYLLQMHALDESRRFLAAAHTAVDCSSDWTRFPRYGYLWDFTPGADAQGKIRRMARYHLNGIQFYDWQYRHHIPVAPDTRAWRDWSGREVDGAILRRYIAAAHEHNMICMAYNMIYAANQTYLADGSGVDAAWRLMKANGEDFTCDMDAELGPVGILQYFNPLDSRWQRYLFAQQSRVFQAFAFDGWHGDTIGENGPMTTAEGGPLGYGESGTPIHLVKDCYTQFLNAAKAALGDKYLVFNPVGAQGIEHVSVSDVDVLYAEFWPWDSDGDGLPYTDYYSLHKAILQAHRQSGGKSLVVAAYVNYRHPSPTFNAAAVRLLDSVVFASGGARIELGNGGAMLSDEYFPGDQNKGMEESLTRDVERMYDFIVAYENLLRDGQSPLQHKVAIENRPVSENGQADTIWCFAKGDGRHEVYHFINLFGTDSAWRDEEQTKKAPVAQNGLVTRLYTDCSTQSVFLASPDGEDLAPVSLPFVCGEDEGGRYLQFTVPSLAYWNMVFLREGA
ncbi:MAG: glycoside hydrolase family 66 protein [Candidatus Limiplasma sp.]|nr:glycoside hydrolase family 66 protein [Candidatus Limiplasma sp.]